MYKIKLSHDEMQTLKRALRLYLNWLEETEWEKVEGMLYDFAKADAELIKIILENKEKE